MGTSSKNYYLVFERLKKLGLNDAEIIEILEKMMHSEQLEAQAVSNEHRLVLYQLLWLLFVRGIHIDKKFILFIPMHFDMVKAGRESLSSLKNHLIMSENTSYEADFDIDTLAEDTLKSDVLEALSFIKNKTK